MRILVLGSNGFVGSNLVPYLKGKEHLIKSVTRSPVKNDEISWDTFLENTTAIIYDAFIHLAGKAHDTKNAANESEYFDVNSDLTVKSFNSFLKSPANTFIYVSSVKAVADMVDGILTEEFKPDPQTPYGLSKKKAEDYLLKHRLVNYKRVFILRPCMIHGPGNKGNLNLLYKFVMKHIPYPLAAFNNRRSFLSISNLNFIIERLISDPTIPGGVYNVADDESLSTNEVIKTIGQANGLTPRLWKVSKGLIRLIALMGDKLHLPLNTERLKKLTENYVVSNHKIKKALHIDHLPVSSQEGLITTIKSFSIR